MDNSLNSFLIGSLGYQITQHITGVIGLEEAITWKSKPIRFVWAILLLGGVACTIWLIYQSAVDFFDEKTATKVGLRVMPPPTLRGVAVSAFAM